MKRTLLSLFLIVAVASVAAFLTEARGDSDDAKPAAKKEAAPEEPRISRDTNGNVVIKLDDEAQKHSALKLEASAAAQFAPELKAYGRVLDPAPLAGLMTELASDQAAAAASSNELARLKTLSGTGNASERALQAAQATALHDQLMQQSAHDRLELTWGREIAEQANLPDFLQSLTGLKTALIRVDLPAGQRPDAPPTGARVVTLGGNSIAAQLLGGALTVDPLTQGQGFILQLNPNQPRLLPGEAVTGYLKLPGEPLAGALIPRDAVVRTEGKGWVYVATDDDHFTRKEIALDRATENGWFVTNGIAAGDKLVITGAQSLLSEESKSLLTPD